MQTMLSCMPQSTNLNNAMLVRCMLRILIPGSDCGGVTNAIKKCITIMTLSPSSNTERERERVCISIKMSLTMSARLHTNRIAKRDWCHSSRSNTRHCTKHQSTKRCDACLRERDVCSNVVVFDEQLCVRDHTTIDKNAKAHTGNMLK
jgi:hypothetical protein